MATVSATKMSSLVKKGKLTGLQVARLIHQHFTDGFNGKEPTGFTEVELRKLASNLDHREWGSVSHWVDGGIDLLYAFAMNVKSDAALAAAELHMVIHKGILEAKTLSIRASIHRVLWYHEALRVVGDYMNADWTLIASRGMRAMDGAIEQINEAMEDNNLAPFDIDSLKPSDEVVEGWEHMVEKINVRHFLLAVVEVEVEVELWEKAAIA